MQLYDRTTSAFPISIGTSLALESLFPGRQEPYDQKRVIPERIDVSDYQECWINLETMIRNISGSVNSVRYLECTVNHILDILREEMEVIESIFQIEGHGLCKPIFYFCSYKSLKKKYEGKIRFRNSHTVYQKNYDYKLKQVLKMIDKETDSIFSLDSEIKPVKKVSSIIITHIPYDLVSYNNFTKLDLLESHTGILKKKTHWNTKYAPIGKQDLSHLPFHRELLLIFGDKYLIEPHERQLRMTIYDISIKDKWTPFTTMDKIYTSFKSHITEPFVLKFLLTL